MSKFYDQSTAKYYDPSVSVDSLSTDDANVGGRDVITNDSETINVPGDADTIQEAVDVASRLLNRHKIQIDIDDGVYNEDVVVPTPSLQMARGGRSARAPLSITGNNTTPSNVKVDSMLVVGAGGGYFPITGLEFQQDTPYTDDDAAFEVMGSNWVALDQCKFAGGTNGVTAYSGHVHVGDLDMGANNLSGDGLRAKKMGVISEAHTGTPTDGNVGGYAYNPSAGWIMFRGDDSNLTGDDGLVRRGGYGYVYDGDNRRIYGPRTFPDRVIGENGFETPNDIAIRGETTGEASVPVFYPQNDFDWIEFDLTAAGGPNLNVAGTDGSQFRVKKSGGFGMRSQVDLSSRTGNFLGEIQQNDGTVNGAGHYEWDGSKWHGIGVEDGNTITP